MSVCAETHGYIPLKDVVYMCNYCHTFYSHEIMTERHVNQRHADQPLPEDGQEVCAVTLEKMVGIHGIEVSLIDLITNFISLSGYEWMMNELDTYIPPNIRLITRSLSGLNTNRRFTADELPTWVEQSQDLMLRSTVSFLIVTYSGSFLTFNHLSNWIYIQHG